MKAITITDERMSQVLPVNIQESEELSANAKKVLAVLINYYFTLSKSVEELGYVYMNNAMLSKSAKLRTESALSAVQELTECNLIKRIAGKKREQGEKATASIYYINWENLEKPVEKPNFNTLFAEFMKKRNCPGTVVVDTDTNVEKDIDKDIEIDEDVVLDVDVVLDEELNLEEDKLLTINSINEKCNYNKMNECNTLTNKELSEETKLKLEEGLKQWFKATLPVTEES